MARQIRISIEDDEVFERMKMRKQELDLSWEEVVHRGLKINSAPETSPTDSYRDQYQQAGRANDLLGNPGGFAADLQSQIQEHIRHSLSESLGDSSPVNDSLDTTVDVLEAAEDATLYFDCLDQDAHTPAYQVPLRVILEAGSEGLSVEVVAIRSGKSTDGMNSFRPRIRRRVIEHLATGGTAELQVGTSDESYTVSPVLTWERYQNIPRVSDVTIDSVIFETESD